MCVPPDKPDEVATESVVSDVYRSPIIACVVTQVIVALLAALMLDGGQFAKLCGIAILAHWAAIGLILFRRPRDPSDLDLALIQYGFVPMVVLVVLVVTRLSPVT